MRHPDKTQRRAAWAAAAFSVALGSLVAVRAQQAAAPAARPMIPAAASSIVLNPDPFYGENVSVMATVEGMLSKTAFTVDQDPKRSTGKELLVLSPTLTSLVVPNTYVTVVGEVIRFDPAEVAKKAKNYTLDLPPDAIAKYQGRPAVLATAVINAAMTDLARRLPPPLTPAEAAFDKVMKQVGPTFNNLRAGLDAPDQAQAKEQVATLKTAFGEAQAFFKARGTADATGWAGDALKLVTSMEQSVAAAKWDDVKTGATNLAQICQTCHTAHRERLEDGSYRIKGDVR